MCAKFDTITAVDTVQNLKKVLALNSKINSTLDIDELLGIIMSTAEEVMSAEAASLMLLEESSQELVFKVALGAKGGELKEKFRVKLGEGIAGWVAQKGESLTINDAQNDKRFAKRFDHATGFQSKAMVCVPMKSKGKVIGILEAINPLGRGSFSGEDLALFEAFADQAAISIENARLHQELVKEELARRDLKIAREIQESFLPDIKQLSLDVDVACQNIPAREVSGDFYDVLKLGESKTGLMIGDVSGKGVPASLYMVRAISDSRFLALTQSDPALFLKELNLRLAKNSRFGIFTTFLYLILDQAKKRIEYASAGHHPILRRKSDSGQVESLQQESGTPLGLFEDSHYPINRSEVESGDVLFLYTDGITEARNVKGEEYGLAHLKESLQTKNSSAQKYSERVFESLNEFTKGAEQHDDITLVSIMIH